MNEHKENIPKMKRVFCPFYWEGIEVGVVPITFRYQDGNLDAFDDDRNQVAFLSSPKRVDELLGVFDDMVEDQCEKDANGKPIYRNVW